MFVFIYLIRDKCIFYIYIYICMTLTVDSVIKLFCPLECREDLGLRVSVLEGGAGEGMEVCGGVW